MGWLSTLDEPTRTRIRNIIGDQTSTYHGTKDGRGQWWVRVSPTTGRPRNVTLLRKLDGTTIREWPLLADGQLLDEHYQAPA